MPFYDYQCNKCEHVWEEMHGMTEEPKILCPECESKETMKLIAAPNHIVKGNGRWEQMKIDPVHRACMKRDMNLHQLQHDDPYADYRKSQLGGDEAVQYDKDGIKARLNKIGTRNHDLDGNYTGKTYLPTGKKKMTAKKKTKKKSK